jgi:nucleoside phosphorylase
VIKDAKVRDQLGQELNAVCVEMEAAGLMNNFPCIVVRGICDYADSHKNDTWQKYAAAAAAAYAKWFLAQVPPHQTAKEERIQDVVGK